MQVMQSPLRIAIALCMSESLYLYKDFTCMGGSKGKYAAILAISVSTMNAGAYI